MKKLFLIFFASLLSISMFAQTPTYSGKTKAQSIPYDWETGIKVDSKAGVGTWYVVGLLKTGEPAGPFNSNGKTDGGMTDINVMVVNPLDRPATIDVVAYIGDNETSRHFTLAAGGSKSMNFGAGMFVRMGIDRVYLYLVMDVDMTPADLDSVQVNVEAVEANSTPFVPVDFVWGDNWATTHTATGNDIPANKETWVKIDRSSKLTSGWTFKLHVQNMGSEATTIYGGLATDCPATNIQEQTKDVAAGGHFSKTLDLAMLDMMPDVIYIRLKANQPLKVWAEEVEPELPEQPLFLATDASAVEKDITYNLSDSIVYKVEYNTLVANQHGADSKYYVVKAEITNNGTTPVTLTGKVAKTFYDVNPAAEGKVYGGVYSAVSRNTTIQPGQKITKELDKTLLSNIESGDEVYALILGGNSDVEFKLIEVCTEEDPCVPAEAIEMTLSTTETVSKNQAANTTKWYAVNIEAAKTNKADIILTMDAGSEEAEVTVDVAADCALGEPTQSYTGKSTSTTKTLNYSLFKEAGNVVYIRVKTNKAITVNAELLTSIKWNGTVWQPQAPASDGSDAVRIEGNLTINGTLKVLGLTLADENKVITIKNGGKLIVGAQGIKGSENVNQIVIEKGGIILIDPAATSNNQPFVTVENTLKLGVQSATGHTLPEWHNFIALPIENREASFAAPLYYAHWDRMDGWIANDGFRHAFVGYNVFAVNGSYYQDPAIEQTVSYKGQLASNKNVTLSLPQDGWYAFGNSWTAPLPLSSIYSQLSGSGDDAAVHFYVDAPTDYAGIGTILDNYYIPATQEIASNLGISNIKPMQGFFLHTESSNSVTLDYNALYNHHKSAAPKRAEDNRNMVAAVLSSGVASDFVYMIEGEAGNASKMVGDKIAIYAEDGMAQIANDNLIGTILTIKTTEETEYTLHFTWLKGETMYIKDLVNGNIIAMTAENQYTFTAEPNTVSERFQVIGRNDAPTGMENNAVIEGANKRIENGKVVIIKNGVKYDVLGTQL